MGRRPVWSLQQREAGQRGFISGAAHGLLSHPGSSVPYPIPSTLCALTCSHYTSAQLSLVASLLRPRQVLARAAGSRLEGYQHVPPPTLGTTCRANSRLPQWPRQRAPASEDHCSAIISHLLPCPESCAISFPWHLLFPGPGTPLLQSEGPAQHHPHHPINLCCFL